MRSIRKQVSVHDSYDKWFVVDGPFTEGKEKFWHCLCDCGNESLVRDYDLKSGKSVGCRTCGSKRAWCNSDISRIRKYPDVPQVVYEKITGAVDNAIKRCSDPSFSRYKDWGGRGIRVKFDDRESFIEHLMTLPGYDNLDLVLDRIDNDGHYEVGNLQFVMRSQSQTNRRNNKDGEPYFMRHGFAQSFKRLHDKGIPFEDIGELYCVGGATVRNCVRRLEGTA